MKNLTINVPDMQSKHCQARVKIAIDNVGDVQIENMEAGKVTVSFADDGLEREVLEAIAKAGYTVAN